MIRSKPSTREYRDGWDKAFHRHRVDALVSSRPDPDYYGKCLDCGETFRATGRTVTMQMPPGKIESMKQAAEGWRRDG